MAITSIDLRRRVALRPLLFTLLIWNFALFPIARIWPDLARLFMLSMPAGGTSEAASAIALAMRLLSYTFVHSGAGHLVGNMLWLMIFGYLIYPRCGSIRFALIYFGGGIAGGLFFILAWLLPTWSGHQPQAMSLCGASAAVIAVTGATLAMMPRHLIRLRATASIFTGHLAIAAIILTFIGNLTPFAIAAHGGGLLFGWIAGRLLEARTISPPTCNPSEMMSAGHNSGSSSFPSPCSLPSPSNQSLPYSSSHSKSTPGREAIMKKLRRSGFSSLTEAEREEISK